MNPRRLDGFATARLVAEPLQEGDLPDLVRLHLDPGVSLYLGGVRSPETTAAYLITNLQHWDRHGFGLWTLRTPADDFVGRAGLRHVTVADRPEVEIAYALDRPFWGQGLASEIAAALMEIAFTRLDLPSVVGVVSIGNAASSHVLQKAGFAFEGRALFHGEDCRVYRRMNGGSA